MQKYRSILGSSVDDAFYGGIGLLIGLVQNDMDFVDLELEKVGTKTYDFYTDSNVSEVHPTSKVLEGLKERVLKELQMWPDHPVLKDVIL